MSEIRIMKRGKVYQYRFEIASRGGVRRYIKKGDILITEKIKIFFSIKKSFSKIDY